MQRPCISSQALSEIKLERASGDDFYGSSPMLGTVMGAAGSVARKGELFAAWCCLRIGPEFEIFWEAVEFTAAASKEGKSTDVPSRYEASNEHLCMQEVLDNMGDGIKAGHHLLAPTHDSDYWAWASANSVFQCCIRFEAAQVPCRMLCTPSKALYAVLAAKPQSEFC
ncbi:unnamed protein product [Gongylonema pulchrum]|uniref:DUF1566 domain-containing protein n=1 Tax=Gongylonema pulchrum TaxID=637853 RepID=A0A183E9L2_9BILA|nr:unnamed protein product [Gongylonema pulchrum]